MNIKKVLLTGGRAPGTLELARFFHQRGIEVHIAESFAYSFIKRSKSIKKFHLAPKPKQQTKTYIDFLIRIIEKEEIELLIPTCEEIFYISQAKNEFPQTCQVFVEEFEIMKMLHNKYEFIQKSKELGLIVPKTILVTNQKEWQEASDIFIGKPSVAKPIYSRFSNELLFLPKDKEKKIDIHPQKKWVIQEFIKGNQYCTYSIVQKGKILAHTTYKTEFTAGKGASLNFQSIEEPKIFNWIEQFVNGIGFTGQIAFDFIRDEKDNFYPIECNPRLTSGIHLFRNTDILDAFLFHNTNEIYPLKETKVAIKLAMLIYIKEAIKSNQFKKWCETYIQSNDVIYDKKDVVPFIYQFISYYQMWRVSKKQKVKLLESTTYDISWDGDEG